MNLQIINGIQIPAFDLEMLILGRLIAVPFNQFQSKGQIFWLYPSQNLPYNLSLEQYYKSNFLDLAKTAISNYKTYPIHIKAWGYCEYHWHINADQKHLLPKTAQSTIWQLNALQHIFEQHQVLKLLILRVYSLSSPCIVNSQANPGAFYWPKSEDLTPVVTKKEPILYEYNFNKRKALLLAGDSYPYTRIETLQLRCEEMAASNPDAQHLNYDIKQFLGLVSTSANLKLPQNTNWINDIVPLGNCSVEQDQGKSNYQAGTDFEIIARKCLDFLGFKVEEHYKGGAGGLDLFCSKPYALVCECKAGKSIPDRTVEELDRIGKRHLKENYLQAIRLIIGPGQPTKNLKESAQISKISIINVMTLQKLVELKAKYPGAINLIELKKYLEAGQIDDKIEEYIDKVAENIKLRSHIVQLVKDYLQNSGAESASVDALHGAYFGSKPPQPIQIVEMHEILIELSSPLTGYLGRIKCSDWKSDRFYYLRDLPMNLQ